MVTPCLRASGRNLLELAVNPREAPRNTGHIEDDLMTQTLSVESLPAALRAEIGERWLEAGLAEHASISSFARFVQELMSLAAPPSLVDAALEAAREEVEHARDSFIQAARITGVPRSPGPLPIVAPRALTLAELAVTTFEEACVEETIGTLLAEAALEHCVDAACAATLRKIAEEEARHAELAWKTVVWALECGGEEVRDALLVARESHQPPELTSPVEDSETDKQLRAFGVVPNHAVPAIHRAAWFDVVVPMIDELLPTPASS